MSTFIPIASFNSGPPPFLVPDHLALFLQVPSPKPGHVLAVERLLSAWAIMEYSEPLFYSRQWMYDDQTNGGTDDCFTKTLEALVAYATQKPHPNHEPVGWTRAVDSTTGTTRRRQDDPDGSWNFYDATDAEKQS